MPESFERDAAERIAAATERARELLTYESAPPDSVEPALRVIARLQRAPSRTGVASGASWARPLAAAAMLAAVAIAGWYVLQPGVDRGDVAATELRQLSFPGCKAELAEETQVSVVQQEGQRLTLRQSFGRAVYEVTPGQQRRVTIQAGDVLVTVKGTRFEVTRQPASTTVKVSHGLVEVRSAARTTLLSAGEELTVRATPNSPPEPESLEQEEAHVEEPGAALETEVAPTAVPTKAEPLDPSLEQERVAAERAAERAKSIAELVERADSARGAGNHAESNRLLRQLISKAPSDPRVASWHFTLARGLRSGGNHAAAARAFAACYRSAPRGALAHDALAEQALAWSSAGNSGQAKAAAERYLALYPKGVYSAKMRHLSR